MTQTSNKAVFLDRDGTLNLDRGYTFKAEDLVFLPGVPEALAKLKRAGFLLVVITNQSGVARGYFTLNDVEYFHKALQDELQRQVQINIDGFYVCPHFAAGNSAPFNIDCDCRKPRAANLLRAITELKVDVKESYMIGDRESDVLAGQAVGMKTILLTDQPAQNSQANWQSPSLSTAVDTIILP